jgi:aspartate aminotransferase
MAVDKTKYLSDKLQLMMAQKARDLRAQGKDVISLSIGEPDFDTPDHIKEAAKKALDEGYTKYTPVAGLPELRQAISDKFKRDNKLEYKPSQIVVSNGAKQSIANIMAALLNPGDEVIVFTPYWVSYFDIIKFAGGTPVLVKAGINQDFKVSPSQLQNSITDKTKAIIFSSPCNPTGSVYSYAELEALAEVIDKYDDLFVISDEIYEHINFLGEHTSIGTFDILKDQTITINGFSKGFAMTGWRLGYMGAPEWLAKACAKVQGQVTSGATSFGQKAAAYALNADMEPTKVMKEAFLKRKNLVRKLLDEIPGIITNDPEGAFYIFPNISSYFGKSNGIFTIKNSNDFAEIILSEGHVALVAGGAFGDDECFRLSYAASEETLIEAIKRIKEVLVRFK